MRRADKPSVLCFIFPTDNGLEISTALWRTSPWISLAGNVSKFVKQDFTTLPIFLGDRLQVAIDFKSDLLQSDVARLGEYDTTNWDSSKSRRGGATAASSETMEVKVQVEMLVRS